MSSFGQPLFVIRKVGTSDFLSGYGAYAVPKLYTRGSANSVVGRYNKECIKYERGYLYEAVPISIVLNEPPKT